MAEVRGLLPTFAAVRVNKHGHIKIKPRHYSKRKLGWGGMEGLEHAGDLRASARNGRGTIAHLVRGATQP